MSDDEIGCDPCDCMPLICLSWPGMQDEWMVVLGKRHLDNMEPWPVLRWDSELTAPQS